MKEYSHIVIIDVILLEESSFNDSFNELDLSDINALVNWFLLLTKKQLHHSCFNVETIENYIEHVNFEKYDDPIYVIPLQKHQYEQLKIIYGDNL